MFIKDHGNLKEEDEWDPLVVSVLDDFAFALDPRLHALVGVLVTLAGGVPA